MATTISPKAKAKSKRCQVKAWSLVITCLIQLDAVVTKLKQAKFGVHQMFATKHCEPEKPETCHIHVGINLRDKPNSTFPKMKEYFAQIFPNATVTENPLKARGNTQKKLQTYYDYCNSQDKHPDELIKTVLHKFVPIEQGEDGLELDKCNIEAYVMHHYENTTKDLRQMESAMNTLRRSQFFSKLTTVKRMIYNYDNWHHSEVTIKPIETFKPEVLAAIQKVWDPSKTTLILRGPPDKGKTELAKAMLHAGTDKNPLVMTNLNKLPFMAKGQGLIFDDMKFDKISRTKAIALTDLANDRDIRILYGIHTIPAGTPKIICTNERYEELLPFGYDEELNEAIHRRVTVVDVTEFGQLYL